MSKTWDQARIQQYINDEVQESLTLEYKAADSLGKSNAKKKEITKDVSAMANSAGGTVIYGVSEYQQLGKKHLPEKIDPIDQTQFSREWLEQVINNIRPRIDGLVIYPVPISGAANHVVYVVEIPQSTTAHQATDWRYYERFNFQSVPMEDYEIRDVMGRSQHPKIQPHFKVEITTEYEHDIMTGKSTAKTECSLEIVATNVGPVYAQYVNCFIQLPGSLLHEDVLERMKVRGEKIPEYYEYYRDNTVRDIVDVEVSFFGPIDKYGPGRFAPILPGLSHTWSIPINSDFLKVEPDELLIKWSIYADNAPPSNGEIAVKDVEVVDLRRT